MPDRDRDDAGRARNARPRDATGKPLEPGARGIPRVPEALDLSPDQAFAEAERYLAADQPFQAHEIFEDQWKQRRAAGAEDTAMWQGLAQVCVGLTHLQRGNTGGAVTLLRRGAENLGPFAAVAELAEWARSAAGLVESGAGEPTGRPRLRQSGRAS
ncbi:MAG: DUF309 domain-containing protein [Sporichthyaceae bacterium]